MQENTTKSKLSVPRRMLEPYESIQRGAHSMQIYHVYILRCADGSYYVGTTANLGQRLSDHQHGLGPTYTRTRLPVAIVYSEKLPSLSAARRREKEIKDWRREKKEQLINWYSLQHKDKLFR